MASGSHGGVVAERDGALLLCPAGRSSRRPRQPIPLGNRFRAGGSSLSAKPSRLVVALELLALAAAAVFSVLGEAHWDIALFIALLLFSVVSDVTASDTSSSVKISGSFLSLVLAMVFLGGPPAAVIGVTTMIVGWLRWRDEPHFLLNNLVAYAWFPLAGGLAFDAARHATGADGQGWFYLLVFGTFMFALAVNFLIIATHRVHL